MRSSGQTVRDRPRGRPLGSACGPHRPRASATAGAVRRTKAARRIRRHALAVSIPLVFDALLVVCEYDSVDRYQVE